MRGRGDMFETAHIIFISFNVMFKSIRLKNAHGTSVYNFIFHNTLPCEH